MKLYRKILACVLVLLIVISLGVSSVGAKTLTWDKTRQEYRDEFFIGLGHYVPESYEDMVLNSLYRYSYVTEYHSNPASADECEPDYVLGFFAFFTHASSTVAESYGDYIVSSNNWYQPEATGFHIYSKADGKVYGLSVAWELGLEGVEEALKIVGRRIGDVNADDAFNIKDATHIQKYLAQIEGYSCNKTFADFNKDSTVDIKDVTAIQKHIAGIAE